MKHFYTDGQITIKRDVDAGDVIPENFHLGRTFKVDTWNKGLTKEDPRVAKNTSKCHATRRARDNYNSWNKGLTKETSKSLAQVASKVSKARKGKSSWNKGIPASEERKQKQSITMKNKDHTSDAYKAKILEANKKSDETKRKNRSFNTSSTEEAKYIELCNIYGKDNVIRQYVDSRYPFKVDFYIKSLDLFIEINGTWVHGPHPFDKNNKEDLDRLAEWTEKSNQSRFYRNAIKVWTERDVIKLNTLRQNNLNFIIEYPKITITN